MLQKFIDIIGANAILLCILLSVFFWVTKKGHQKSNRILTLSLLSFGLLIFSTMPGASYSYSGVAKFAFILRRSAFLIAPFFYLYIKSLVDSKFVFKKVDLLHFLPFLLTTLFVAYQGLVKHIWWITFTEEYYLHTFLIVLHNVIYLFMANSFLKGHGLSLKKVLLNEKSDTHGLLKLLIVGFSVFWIINLQNLFVLQVLKIYSWCPYGGSVYCLIPFLFLSFLTLYVLIKPELVTKPKNGNGRLNAERLGLYQAKVANYVVNQKPYFDADLSIKEMARDLSMSTEDLSYVLNKAFNTNFYDYINCLRIKESKRLLTESDENILEIAYRVGFNSKSTFNSAFKKHAGVTPSEFRKKIPSFSY